MESRALRKAEVLRAGGRRNAAELRLAKCSVDNPALEGRPRQCLMTGFDRLGQFHVSFSFSFSFLFSLSIFLLSLIWPRIAFYRVRESRCRFEEALSC